MVRFDPEIGDRLAVARAGDPPPVIPTALIQPELETGRQLTRWLR